MRERADAGEADGKLAVVGVGEPDAGGLDQKAKLIGVDERRFGVGSWRGARERGCFLWRNHGLLKRAVGQPDAALEPFGERARRFQDNRHVEVPRQGHLLTDWKLF